MKKYAIFTDFNSLPKIKKWEKFFEEVTNGFSAMPRGGG